MAVLSIGQMWADEEVVYTLTPVQGSDNGYGSAEDIAITDGETTITWSVMGNSKDYAPWRIGGKGITNAIRPIYSKNAISDNVTKVVVTHGTKNISTVSLKLYVYSSAAKAASGGSTDLISTVDGGTLSGSDVITFNRPTGHDWTGRFYRLEYCCTQSGSSNKYILFNEAKFYAEAAAPAYTIAAQSNDESKGTVSLSGSVITGSPKVGFRYASPAYSVSPANSAEVSQNGNAFTVTPSANTTVTINFEAIPQYVVTWNVNGNEDTKTNVYVGEKPVFPATPAACDATSTTFIGWATAPWTGKLADLSEKTVYTSASAMPDVDAAVTYYAVFAKSSGSASNLFSWAGGTKAELTAAEGVAELEADNSDYAEANAPYRVKWNGTGKYIIISVASQPGQVSAGFKMIGGGTTSTITVQEADDAEGPFTDVENLAISGSSNDVVNIESTQAFKSTTRAIKLYYTKGSNVGLGPISIEGAVSMSDYMTTCCTQHAVNIAAGIEHGSVSADPASACEGATITLTFTPALNYHLSAWTLNGEAQDVNVNTFSMPAGAATVSATFAQDACDPLATPVVAVSGKAYPYNAVKLAWTAIEHADAYKVYIYDNEDNELEHNDAFTGVEYTIGQTLSASTTYKYSVQAISNTPATYCPSTEAESTFTTDALPTAKLTLKDPSGTHASSGDYAILTPFNLPATAASCSKEFRGWDSNENCTTAPTYAKGAEFTFPNTTGVTLYAVYADELTPGTSSYVKTALADIASGSEVVVTETKGDDMWALSYNPSTSKTVAAAVSEDENILDVSSLTNGFWTLSKDGDNFTLTVVGGTDKLYCNNTNDGVRVGSGDANTFSINNNYLYTSATSDARYLGVYNGNDFRCYTSINSNITGQTLAFFKKVTSEGTYGNYSTTCVAAPTATPASASIEVAAAGGSSTLGVTYENVNLAGVEVALFNNEACTEAFDGGWLTASIAGDDKHIAYSAQENTTSYVARTAYIKLTAPETNGAADPAVVVIPVTQAKYIPVYANLAALVEANLSSGTDVTVSFANEVITNDHYISQGTKRAGVMLTTEAANDKAIEIFYNKGETVVPAEWVVGGSLSATAKTFTWTFFNDQWELVPLGNDWTWDNGDLTYTAPKTVSSVVVTGAPTKTTYVDGEKFAPAGLTVTVNYSDATSEVNPVGVTFECTPARVAKSDDPVSVSVIATFNEIASEAFEVTGLTVGDIQLKTVAEFIAAGNADMRCYLEGTVSDIETGNKLKYGNFNLTDASGTIYVYGCLNQAGEAEHFEDLDVHNGDKIKVIAEDYDYYNTKHEAKNVQFVSKKPVATMTFDAMEMETGDVETIAPKTITLAEASAVAYSIKEGSDDCVSLDGAQITATAAGTATIVATLTETTAYVGTTAEFTVTVTAPDTRKIANASAFEAISGDMTPADIAFAAYKGDGTNAPVLRSSDNPVAIRLYKPATTGGTGNYLTLTAKVGCTIDQVQVTFSGNADAAYCKDDEALPTEKYITSETVLLTPAGLNAQSVSIVNLKNGSIDVNAIKVWYNGEPLAIHHYILGGTYETTFEQNTTFSYEGLTVTAAYDELETITEPITDFTVVADLSEEGPATASVRRNDAEIATYAITVTPGKANPNLAYTPNELEVAAADVASWVAPEFSNPFEVSPITYSSNKTAVAKVTSDGVITLQGGYGTAVITASFAGNNDYIASQATYTITVNEPVDDIKGHWVATNAVQAGMEIIIANVADANGNVKTMGSQNSNNRAAVESTVNEKGVLSPASGTKIFTLVDAGNGELAIQALNGNYLYAASTSSNHLKETSDINNVNAKWTITIEEGVATIKALHDGHTNRNWMRYNSDNNIFSCYASGQEDLVIYAINDEVKEGETIDASSLREDEDIVINGNASMTINDEVSLGDIYVKENQTVTITVTENATLGNLDLENGAILDLDVTPGKTVEANDLVLRSSSATNGVNGVSSQAPVMPVVNGVLALEIQLRPDEMNAENSSKWYCIAAPFDVDINSGFEWVHPNGSRTPMVHNVDFQIFEYDGERRASGISGWKRIGGTMKAGVAHFIGFDNARTNQNTIRLTAKTNTVAPVTEIALGEYPGATDVQNWNGVANPTMQYIGIDKDIVAFDYDIQDYNTYASTGYNYFVGSPFFIQQAGGSIAVDHTDRGGAIHAPKFVEDKLEYCVRINAASANRFESQMYVRASETASNSYEEGHDLASQCSTTPKYGARIWTENYNVRLGIEEAPLTNGNATYVLGIATPSAGEYTISVAAPKENADLYLTYNGSIIWNLSEGAYTVELPKGVTSGYGLVLQAKAPHVATGVDNAEANEAGVQKVIINNHVYILRAEQMYDVTGKAVK